MDRCAQADLESPDFARFPQAQGQASGKSKFPLCCRSLQAVRAVEAVLGPGDLLVLPAGWLSP